MIASARWRGGSRRSTHNLTHWLISTQVPDDAEIRKAYRKALAKGLLKVMSKMGVSTVASYTGAQIFEAIGLGEDVVDRYFTGTVSQLGGIGLDEIAAEYGFWLGDAFASGGSKGYDHKAIGITARGAWECVKHHFREQKKDIQSEPSPSLVSAT